MARPPGLSGAAPAMPWSAPKARTRRDGMVARAKAQVLTRDYFRVEDETGLRFWLYRDGLYDREIVQLEGQAVSRTGSCMGCSHEHSRQR